MATKTKEHYLKAIYFLQQRQDKVTITSISNDMGVSKPTANSMIKKLNLEGLINYTKYQPITLTESGILSASSIVRKHRLAEMFLVQFMDFGWEEVHNIAEELEHVDSEQFFDRIDELLGSPRFDPHGSPIPNTLGQLPPFNYRRLVTCKENTTVILKAVEDSSKSLLEYLTAQQICIGSEIMILSIIEYDKSMEISSAGQKTTLSRLVCEKLLVE